MKTNKTTLTEVKPMIVDALCGGYEVTILINGETYNIEGL